MVTGLLKVSVEYFYRKRKRTSTSSRHTVDKMLNFHVSRKVEEIPLVPLGQGLSTVVPVWVWGQSMALLLVASQKRLGVGGSSGIVGSAVLEPRLSSNGSLPSLGSAPATVVSPRPFTVDTAVVVVIVVVLGMADETEASSVVGTRDREREGESSDAVRARDINVLALNPCCFSQWGGLHLLWASWFVGITRVTASHIIWK